MRWTLKPVQGEMSIRTRSRSVRRFVGNAKQIFENGGRPGKDPETEIKELHAKIGQKYAGGTFGSSDSVTGVSQSRSRTRPGPNKTKTSHLSGWLY